MLFRSRKMTGRADSLIVVSNDGLFKFVNEHIILPRSFWMSDMIVLQLFAEIERLIHLPALINLDFEDIQLIMGNKGIAYVGVGKGKGDHKAIEAAKMATEIPFLETTISGATHAIINILGDISLMDFDNVASYIQDLVGDKATIICGMMPREVRGSRAATAPTIRVPIRMSVSVFYLLKYTLFSPIYRICN